MFAYLKVYSRYTGIFIVFLLTLTRLTAGEMWVLPSVEIKANATQTSLLGHLLMLRDPRGSLDLQAVAFGAEKGAFLVAPSPISLGYTADTYWFKTTIENHDTESRELYVWIQPNFVDNIELYYSRIPNPQTVDDFHEVKLGDHVDVEARTGHAPFQFAALDVPGSAPFDLYIRVHTTSSLIFGAWIGSSSAFANTAALRSFQLGFAFAFLITLSLVIFLAWARLGTPVLLWFGLFVLALSMNIFPMSGFGMSWLRGVNPALPDQFCQFAILVCHFFGLGYMARQTHLKARSPRLDTLNNIAMGYVLFGLLCSLLGYYQNYMVSELVVASIILSIFTYKNIQQSFDWRGGARMAAIGCSFYAIAAISYHAALVGAFAPTSDLIAFISLGNLVFVALMAVSLLQQAGRIEFLRREHELLALSRRAERQASQLVAERTTQLISAKEAAERALEQERAAQAEQLRFVDVVTHQYRTPLAIIRSCVTAIRYAIAPQDADNRRRVGQIEAAVQRLVEMMDISLHRSRVEGYAGKANRRTVKIVPDFSTLLSRFRELHMDRQIIARFDGIERDEDVMIDLDMVAIAIGNLIDNAAKFSAASAPIEIRVSRRDAWIQIEVCDEGIGIPEGEIGKVGQRYFRASNSGSIFGTGLGLNIVQQVAIAHGGDFRIANRREGGAVAHVTLLAVQAE